MNCTEKSIPQLEASSQMVNKGNNLLEFSSSSLGQLGAIQPQIDGKPFGQRIPKRKKQELCGDFYQTGGGHSCLLSLSKEIPMFERAGRKER